MDRKRIAIACQGGGSQCAFVAGALKTMLDRGVQHRYEIVGLSGTSGGALTAAVAWYALLEEARGKKVAIGDRIVAVWKDLSAQTPLEVFLDGVCTRTIRMIEDGLLPSVARSPSSPQFQMWSRAAAMAIARPEFTDLRALLLKHLDFAALPSLIQPDSPVLLAGAGDVLEGTFKIFSSARGEISADAILASAAVPNLFPAVWVEGHAYWDGIFASNPPLTAFLRSPLMGRENIPEEIWIIQINRPQNEQVPERASDISDRRNQLAGNLSLQHELQVIAMVNMLLQEGALTPRFRARFGMDATEAIAVRFIRMSKSLQESLDYPSKLSRQPGHIDRLIADGEEQASEFLASLTNGDGRPQLTAGPPDIEERVLSGQLL